MYDDINKYKVPSLSIRLRSASAPCSARTFNEDQSLLANAIETGVLPVRTISYNHVIMISIHLQNRHLIINLIIIIVMKI